MKNALFQPSEWDWFKLQLDLHSLKTRVNSDKVRFLFDDETHEIQCWIWNSAVQRMRKNKSTQQDQLQFYQSWVQSLRKTTIEPILAKLLVLKKEFNIDKDIIFVVLEDLVNESITVCEIKDNNVNWGPHFTKPSDGMVGITTPNNLAN